PPLSPYTTLFRSSDLGARHDAAQGEPRVPVREAELVRRPPGCAGAVDDECAREDLGPVASVGASVHPHAAADRSRDRAGELEAAETRGARTVKADGIRCPAAGDEEVALNLRRPQLPAQPDDERVDPLAPHHPT